MNEISRKHIAKIMFCYALAYEHYKNESIKNSLLNAIEQVINEYIPTERFTLHGRDVVVVRESVRNSVYRLRQQIENRLPKFNEILIGHNLHSSPETILSLLYYLVEEYLEKTNNPDRYKRWKYLDEICQQDEAYAGTNEDPAYMGTVEKCYNVMIDEVLQAIKDVR